MFTRSIQVFYRDCSFAWVADVCGVRQACCEAREMKVGNSRVGVRVT
jgi:hypothetical protein